MSAKAGSSLFCCSKGAGAEARGTWYVVCMRAVYKWHKCKCVWRVLLLRAVCVPRAPSPWGGAFCLCALILVWLMIDGIMCSLSARSRGWGWRMAGWMMDAQ